MLPWTPAMEQLRQQYANRIEELENDLQSQHYPNSSQNTPTTSLTPRTRWVSSGMHRNPPFETRPATEVEVEGQQNGTSDRELQHAKEKLHFTERKLEQMEVPREDAPCTARGSRSACACRRGRSKPKGKWRR